MNEFVGVIDVLIGFSLFYANLFSKTLLSFPSTHKFGLYLAAVGMVYHGSRNIAPEQFLQQAFFIELSHVGLWVIVLSVGLKSWKGRKKPVSIL